MHTLQISYVLIGLIALALLFDFMNGFHDAANAIATVVSTGVLKPQHAVAIATVFNFIAILVFQSKVANTIGKELLDASVVDQYVIFGALVGALIWNLITWFYSIPSSSSHALIGGLIGAAVSKAGAAALLSGGLIKIISFIILAPLLSYFLGSLIMLIVAWLFVRATPRYVDKWFGRMQLLSSCAYCLCHGGNDAQKTMGVIWMLLLASGALLPNDQLPLWVSVCCYSAISLGTLFGGQRIIKTLGQKITKLKPVGGFCAETGSAITLFFATIFGIPVSTMHTIAGAIVGVGSVQNTRSVRWSVARSICFGMAFYDTSFGVYCGDCVLGKCCNWRFKVIVAIALIHPSWPAVSLLLTALAKLAFHTACRLAYKPPRHSRQPAA